MSNAEIVAIAKVAAEKAPNWIEFSNYMFHPVCGLLAKAFPKPDDRDAFFNSPECQVIEDLLAAAIERDGFDYDPTRPRHVLSEAAH